MPRIQTRAFTMKIGTQLTLKTLSAMLPCGLPAGLKKNKKSHLKYPLKIIPPHTQGIRYHAY